MKKILFLFGAVNLLGACSTPPDPVDFPHKANGENVQTAPFMKREHNVPLNRFDKTEWQYRMITTAELLNEAEKTKIWYLAHHATDIQIQGDFNEAEKLKRLFLANGVTARITFDSLYNHGKTLSVHFAKVKPQPQGGTI